MKKLYLKKDKLLSLCLSISLLLVFMSCKDAKKSESFGKYYRIIDHLSEDNITHTPLKGLVKRFPFVKENISRTWKYVRELSDKNIETWAVSTEHPVLRDTLAVPGEGIGFLRNGEKVAYLSTGTVRENSWKWIKTGEVFDLKAKERYNRRRKGIELDAKHPLKFKKLLPAGKVVLSLTIDTLNRVEENYRPVLIISFNDKYEKQIKLKRPKKKLFKFQKKLEQGFYNIKIKIKDEKGSPDNDKRNFVIIKQVKINSNSDVLLYTKKPEKQKTPPQGQFQFRYYSYDSLDESMDPALLLKTLYLYHLQERFPIKEPAVGPNPFFIKKKLRIGENSLNALIAPYSSEYTFRLKMPARCRLEFGCGFLDENLKHDVSKKIVNFKIVIKSGEGQKTLHDENIKSVAQGELKTKEVDLSPFEGQEVTLFFITDLIKKGHKRAYKNIPVWINPIIYQTAANDDMNIVLISLDTVRPDYLGCFGYPKDTSPNIDRFAEDAVLFLNAYSTASWTLPAHISLMTSLNCLHHQVYYPYEKMDAENFTFSEILRGRDFYTAAFTGGGFLSSTYGFAKGFDEYQELRSHNKEAIRSDEAEYLARQSVDFITKNKGKRFFLFLHTYQPHDPYNNPSPTGKKFLPDDPKWREVSLVDLFKKTGRFNHSFSDKEKRNIAALYEGEIGYTDEVYVKPVIARLKQLKIYDKTMIILLSDHGEEFYDHEAYLHDHSLYEEAIKIPLIIKFPYSRNKGKKIKNIVRITDVLPTILEEANIAADIYKFDGESLLPIIKGIEKKNRNFLCDLALRGLKAPKIITMNRGNFKFILNEKVASPYVKKVVEAFADFKIELYDLEKDPRETVNLAKQKLYHKMCVDFLKEIQAIYKDARRKSEKKNKVIMDKSLIEKLKALGYIE